MLSRYSESESLPEIGQLKISGEEKEQSETESEEGNPVIVVDSEEDSESGENCGTQDTESQKRTVVLMFPVLEQWCLPGSNFYGT